MTAIIIALVLGLIFGATIGFTWGIFAVEDCEDKCLQRRLRRWE